MFLYGDSDSVPDEEQTCVEIDPVVSSTDRLDAAWSDEEDDPFVKTPATTVAHINSKLAKELSNSQSEIQDIVKLPKVEKDENLIEDAAPPLGISDKTGVSCKLESSGSLSSPATGQNEFPEASSAAVRHESQNTGGVGTAWSDEDPFAKLLELLLSKKKMLILC